MIHLEPHYRGGYPGSLVGPCWAQWVNLTELNQFQLKIYTVPQKETKMKPEDDGFPSSESPFCGVYLLLKKNRRFWSQPRDRLLEEKILPKNWDMTWKHPPNPATKRHCGRNLEQKKHMFVMKGHDSENKNQNNCRERFFFKLFVSPHFPKQVKYPKWQAANH